MSKLKKRLAVLLAVCMVAALLPAGVFAADYSDLPNDYSTKALQAAVKNGLLQGSDGKLMPKANLKRAEMAAILVRAFGAQTQAPLVGFTDVSAEAWYYEDMGKAVFMKIMQGDADRLNPTGYITRQEAFVMLARALRLPDGIQADLAAFTDVSAVAPWAMGATSALVKAGYIQGADGKLNPKAHIIRKDFAVMMDNIIKTYLTTTEPVSELATGSVMINVPGVTLKNVTVQGDLIVGDGVGSGTVTLDGVTVTGRTIVRGGGVNSLVIKGDSKLGAVIVTKVDGNVRVLVSGNAAVSVVEVQDGKNDVLLEGNLPKITVASDAVPVVVQNAKVDALTVNGDNASITVAKTATIGEVAISGAGASLGVSGTIGTVKTADGADNAAIKTESGAKITTVISNGDKLTVSGADNTVGLVKVESGDGAKVTTTGSKVEAGKDASNVTAGDKPLVPGGTTEIPKPDTSSDDDDRPARADIKVTTEDFGIVNTTGYWAGVTAGFRLDGAGLSQITGVKAELFSDSALLAVNTLKSAKLTELHTAKQWSTPFVVAEGSFLKANDEYWSIGDFVPVSAQKPTKVVFTVTDRNGYTYTAENATLTETPATADWQSLCGYVKTVSTATELTNALASAKAQDILLVLGTLGSESDYSVYHVAQAVTIKGVDTAGAKAKIYGSFAVTANGATFENLAIENCYTGSNDGANKNAINAYADSLTVKNCAFAHHTAPEVCEPNGIVIFPKTAAGSYAITGNSFTGYNAATTDGAYCSAAVFVAEGYAMQKKPFLVGNNAGSTAESAVLSTSPDAAFAAGGNSFVNCAYAYLRASGYSLSEWSSLPNSQKIHSAIVCNEAALKNAVKYAADSATVVQLNANVELTQTLTVSKAVQLSGGHTNGKFTLSAASAAGMNGELIAVEGCALTLNKLKLDAQNAGKQGGTGSKYAVVLDKANAALIATDVDFLVPNTDGEDAFAVYAEDFVNKAAKVSLTNCTAVCTGGDNDSLTANKRGYLLGMNHGVTELTLDCEKGNAGMFDLFTEQRATGADAFPASVAKEGMRWRDQGAGDGDPSVNKIFRTDAWVEITAQ